MHVSLVGETFIAKLPDVVLDTPFFQLAYLDLREGMATEAEVLMAFAGRNCYQSWSLPNPDTAGIRDYVRSIVHKGHFSVLEHASASFYIDGVSRNFTHELIRHRHLSFSELSQRYVDMHDANFITPPALRELPDTSLFEGSVRSASQYHYDTAMTGLADNQVSGKRAREAARAYIPGGMETKIVVSGNHRAWRDVLLKRCSPAADAEMQAVAYELLGILRELAPSVYDDLPDRELQ